MIAAELKGAERAGMPPPADLAERRAGLAAAIQAGYWRTDVPPAELVLSGVRCLRFAAPEPARGTVLHLHGGAFRIGFPEQLGPFAAALASQCQVDVVCPAYRLAPEFPYPAGQHDAFVALAELARGTTGPLIVSGDSAGGGLAASLIMLAARAGISVTGLALLSPWLDLTLSSSTYDTNAASDPLFSRDAARDAASQYLQGAVSADPLASPLLGDLAAFPPTYLNVGSGEVLLGDAARLDERLREVHIPVAYCSIEGMDHVAVTRDLGLPGSAEAFAGLCAFIDSLVLRS